MYLRILVIMVMLAVSGGVFAHETTPFGQPGDPGKEIRTIHVTMGEKETKMLFVPDMINVKKGEQIRFVVDNEGIYNHEFVLGTERSLLEHAAEMKKHPHMVHADAHSLSVAPYARGELLWRFTKSGHYAFACLIPGHLERGMRGTIVVK